MLEKIYELLGEKKYAALRTLLTEENPADVAETFESLPDDILLLLFRVLTKDQLRKYSLK